MKVLTNSNDFILSVQNSGTPISDDSKARLFQPFWRKESNRQNEGLGLGLFIASEIAKAHKGTLGVNSDYNGTEFTLRFPLQTVSSNIFES